MKTVKREDFKFILLCQDCKRLLTSYEIREQITAQCSSDTDGYIVDTVVVDDYYGSSCPFCNTDIDSNEESLRVPSNSFNALHGIIVPDEYLEEDEDEDLKIKYEFFEEVNFSWENVEEDTTTITPILKKSVIASLLLQETGE